MKEAIWVKILLGNLKLLISSINLMCFFKYSLNQSLQWPFYERTATAVYDFTPREPNQLTLKKGCLICEFYQKCIN